MVITIVIICKCYKIIAIICVQFLFYDYCYVRESEES